MLFLPKKGKEMESKELTFGDKIDESIGWIGTLKSKEEKMGVIKLLVETEDLPLSISRNYYSDSGIKADRADIGGTSQASLTPLGEKPKKGKGKKK